MMPPRANADLHIDKMPLCQSLPQLTLFYIVHVGNIARASLWRNLMPPSVTIQNCQRSP